MSEHDLKPLNAVMIEEYTIDGENEPRKAYTNVGIAFPHRNGKGGYTVRIRKGIAVSGELHLFPQQEKKEAGEGGDDYNF